MRGKGAIQTLARYPCRFGYLCQSVRNGNISEGGAEDARIVVLRACVEIVRR